MADNDRFPKTPREPNPMSLVTDLSARSLHQVRPAIEALFQELAPGVDAHERIRELALVALQRYNEEGRPIPAHLQAALDATGGAPVSLAPLRPIHITPERPNRTRAVVRYVALAACLILTVALTLFWVQKQRTAPHSGQEIAMNSDKNSAGASTAVAIAEDRARRAYNEGVSLMYPAGYERAVAAFTRAIELRPNDVNAYYNRAVCLMNLERHAEAAQDFTEVIRRKDRMDARDNRAICYVHLNKLREAEADYSVIIKNASSAQAYTKRAAVRRLLGDFEGAEADHAAAAKTSPKP